MQVFSYIFYSTFCQELGLLKHLKQTFHRNVGFDTRLQSEVSQTFEVDLRKRNSTIRKDFAKAIEGNMDKDM